MTYRDQPLFPPPRPIPMTERQRSLLAEGKHPLSGAGSVPRLVLLAPEGTGTCGTCRHRVETESKVAKGYRKGAFPKCLFGARLDKHGDVNYAPRASGAESTDCQAEWPACAEYQVQKKEAAHDA